MMMKLWKNVIEHQLIVASNDNVAGFVIERDRGRGHESVILNSSTVLHSLFVRERASESHE